MRHHYKILRLTENHIGRDFVVGDIHGSFRMVADAMRQVHFDGKRDRLFCVGDLVDRGADSAKIRDFLNLPNVYSTLGNHEAMFMEMYLDGEPDQKTLEIMTTHPMLGGKNGMQWWVNIPHDEQQKIIGLFKTLPLLIEIETSRGLVGLIHGEVPPGMDWGIFKQMIENGHDDTIQSALWGRERIKRKIMEGVEGVGRIYCGHTPVPGIKRQGNIYFMDTGAVFRDMGADGRLTMVNMVMKTAGLLETRADEPVDVRDGCSPDTPFGKSGYVPT